MGKNEFFYKSVLKAGRWNGHLVFLRESIDLDRVFLF